MKHLAEIISRELQHPAGCDLQERLLQAMFVIESCSGIDAGWRDAGSEVADAIVDVESLRGLASALERFIRGYPSHRDVGSAVWALGKLRSPSHIDLFRAVVAPDSRYNEWAQIQACRALEDQGFETGKA